MTYRQPWEWSDRNPSDWLPDDLSITIDANSVASQFTRLQGFLEVQQLYQAAINEIRTKLETLDTEFSVRFSHNPIHHINSRLKTPQSILEKLRRKGLAPSMAQARENLMDIAGVRVVCNYIEDIYDVAELLEKQSDLTLVRRRDYIAHPKENGYRSLHLVAQVPVYLSDRVENVPVEIQVRTIAMDFWATLEHELRYKSANEMNAAQRVRLKQCAETSAQLDLEMQALRNQCIRQQRQKREA